MVLEIRVTKDEVGKRNVVLEKKYGMSGQKM
jgi:hypothetical protein